jgi:hypothetical protein
MIIHRVACQLPLSDVCLSTTIVFSAHSTFIQPDACHRACERQQKMKSLGGIMTDPPRVALALILVVAALVGAGCPEQSPPIAPNDSPTTAAAVSADALESIEAEQLGLDETEKQSRAIEDVVREREHVVLAKQSKEVFILEIQNVISDAEYRIQQLKRKVAKLEDDERQSIEETIDALEAAVERVADGLARVVEAEALEWEDFREEVERAIFDLDSIREPSRA